MRQVSFLAREAWHKQQEATKREQEAERRRAAAEVQRTGSNCKPTSRAWGSHVGTTQFTGKGQQGRKSKRGTEQGHNKAKQPWWYQLREHHKGQGPLG